MDIGYGYVRTGIHNRLPGYGAPLKLKRGHLDAKCTEHLPTKGKNCLRYLDTRILCSNLQGS